MTSSSNPELSKMFNIPNPPKTPFLTANEVSILVSPSGTIYLLCETTKSIIWSFNMKTQIYNAYHDNNQQNGYRYIDGNTNSEGDIVLYHHSSSSSSSSSDSPSVKVYLILLLLN